MWIGVDFGTTNTVAAVMGDDGRARVLALDPMADNPSTLRTMIYVERDGAIHFGADAIQTYHRQNVGRIPRFARQWIGMIDIEIGDMVVKGYEINAGPMAVDVFADVDADAPGRLMHSLKGPLATDYHGTNLYGQYFTLEALIAEFLRHVRERVVALTHEPIEGVVLGRPVHFANARHESDDARAQDRLEASAKLAGFERVRFELEPVAAGLSASAWAGHTLVFDFGGGTLDVAVLGDASERSRVLATGGVGIAGDHFDRVIFQRSLLAWFGRDVKWGAQRLDMPNDILNALGDWQDIPALARPDMLAFLRQAQGDCTDPARLFALEDLIFKGYAYALYERVESSKVALSTQRLSVIDYSAGGVEVWQPLTRAQFESFIARERRTIRDMIEDTLRRAGVRADEITRVARTGGSSSIPAFVEMLSEMFGAASIESHALFTGVASGLALRAASFDERHGANGA